MYKELECIKIDRPYMGWSNLNPAPTTLDKLYKQGWWITEFFGSYAVIVKKSKLIDCGCPRFRVLYKRINLTHSTKRAMNTIERIKQERWNTYKKYMLVGVPFKG